MRTVTLSDGATIEVRGLTRRELKALKQFGVGYTRFDVKREDFDTVMDQVLEEQIESSALDNTSNADVLKLFDGIIAETYGDKDEEKNSSRSGPQDQTREEKRPATDV